MTSGKKFLSFLLIALSSVLFIGSLNLKPRQTYAEDSTAVSLSKTYKTTSLKVGDYLEFGEYPQSEMPADFYFIESDYEKEQVTGYYVAKHDIYDASNKTVLLKKDEKIHVLKIADNYKEKYPIYLAENGTTKSGDGFVQKETGVNNNPLDPRSYVDDIQKSGKSYYIQNNTVIDNGYPAGKGGVTASYYFKVEPIKWMVVSTDADNNLTLVSTLVLDAMDFNLFDSNGNIWAYSYLRNWLNYGSEYDNNDFSYMSKSEGRRYVGQNKENGKWYYYFNDWQDWGDYGYGCNGLKNIRKTSEAKLLVDGKGSRGSIRTTYNNRTGGSFYLRAFNGLFKYLVPSATTSVGNYPYYDYKAREETKEINVNDYVKLVSASTNDNYILNDKVRYYYQSIQGYSDYSVANGFVAKFNNTSNGIRKIDSTNGNIGYVWSMDSTGKDVGHQYIVRSSQNGVHNVRSVLGGTFNKDSVNLTPYSGQSSSLWCTATPCTCYRSQSPNYCLNSMDQSYGVVPQIVIKGEALGDYLLARDGGAKTQTGVQNTIGEINGTGVTYYVGKFEKSYYYGSASISYIESKSDGYLIRGSFESDIQSQANGYLKFVLSADALSEDYLKNCTHPVNEGGIQYAYARLEKTSKSGVWSFEQRIKSYASKQNLHVYVYYVSEDLKTTWAVEEDAGKILQTRTRKITKVVFNQKTPGNENDYTMHEETEYIFSNYRWNYNLGNPKPSDSADIGKWFKSEASAREYLKNPDYEAADEIKDPWTEEIKWTSSVDAPEVKFYKVTTADRVAVRITGEYDGSYYLKQNEYNSIYPSGNTNTILFYGYTGSNLRFDVVIKYSHIRNGNFYDASGKPNNLYYELQDVDGETKRKIVMYFDSTAPAEKTVSTAAVREVTFPGTKEVKELRYTIVIDSDKVASGKDFLLQLNKNDNSLSKYNIEFDTTEKNIDNSDKVSFDGVTGGTAVSVDNTTSRISDIPYDGAVSTKLKFASGYYIKPTKDTQGRLGINIPTMGFNYAGIVRDDLGYRYADGATYSYSSDVSGKYSYNKQVVRIDSQGRMIEFDNNENRIYYIERKSSDGTTALYRLTKNNEDGTYSYIDNAHVTDSSKNNIGFYLQPTYAITLTEPAGAVINITFGPNNWVDSDKRYETTVGGKAAELYVLNKDSVRVVYYYSEGASFSAEVFVDNSSNPSKTVLTRYTVTAQSQYSLKWEETQAYVITTEELDGRISEEDTSLYTILAPKDNEHEDYGFEGRVTNYTMRMTIANSDTRYYNPWVEYVTNSMLFINGSFGNTDGKTAFQPFSNPDTKKLQEFSYSTGTASNSWSGGKVWFVKLKNGTIQQLTSFTNSLPTYDNNQIERNTSTGLWQVRSKDGSILTCFAIDGIDVSVSYNIETNVIDFGFTFDHVLSNIKFNFKNIAKYDYSIRFVTDADGLSRDERATIGSYVTHNGEGMLLSTADSYRNLDTSDFTDLGEKFLTYTNILIDGENVMAFLPITIGNIDYYLCPGGSSWTEEQLDITYGNNNEYTLIRLTNNNSDVNYILKNNTNNARRFSSSGTAKELIGFKLVRPELASCIKLAEGTVLAKFNGSDYYTLQNLSSATFTFEGNNTTLEFIAIYDTCEINVSISAWTAEGEYDLINSYATTASKADEFKVVKEGNNTYYYLKGVKYGAIINDANMSELESHATNKVTAYAQFRGFYRQIGDVETMLRNSKILKDNSFVVEPSSGYRALNMNGRAMYVYYSNGAFDYSRLIFEFTYDLEDETSSEVTGVIGYSIFTSTSSYKSGNVQLIALFETQLYEATVDLGDNSDAVGVDASKKSYISGTVSKTNLEFVFTLTEAYNDTVLTMQDFKIMIGSTELTANYTVEGSHGVFVLIIAAEELTGNITISFRNVLKLNSYEITLTDPTDTLKNNTPKPNNPSNNKEYEIGNFGWGDVTSNSVSYGGSITFKFTQKSAIQLNKTVLNLRIGTTDYKYTLAGSGLTLPGIGVSVTSSLSGLEYTVTITGVKANITVTVDSAELKQYTLNGVSVDGASTTENTSVDSDSIARVVATTTTTTATNTLTNLYGDTIAIATALTAGYTKNIVVFYINNTPIFPAWKCPTGTAIGGEGRNANISEITLTNNTYEYTASGMSIRLVKTANEDEYTLIVDGVTMGTLKLVDSTYTLTFEAQLCEGDRSSTTVQIGIYDTTLTTANVINSYDQSFDTKLEPGKENPVAGEDNIWKYYDETSNSYKTIGTAEFSHAYLLNLEYGKKLVLTYVAANKYTHTLPVLKVGGVPYYIPGLGVEYADLKMESNGSYTYDKDGIKYTITPNLNNYTYTYTQEVNGQRVTILKITIDAKVFGANSTDKEINAINLNERFSSGTTFTYELLVTGENTIANDVTFEENQYYILFTKRTLKSNGNFEQKGAMLLRGNPYTQTVAYQGTAKNPFTDTTLGLSDEDRALLGIEDGFSYDEERFSNNTPVWWLYNVDKLTYEEYVMSTLVTEHVILATTFIENQYSVTFNKLDSQFGYLTSTLTGNNTIGNDTKVFADTDTATSKTRTIEHSDINNNFSFTLYVMAKFDQTKPVINFSYDAIGNIPLYDSLTDNTFEVNGKAYRYQNTTNGRIAVRKNENGIYEYLYGRLNSTNTAFDSILLNFTIEETVIANADRSQAAGKYYKVSFNKVCSTAGTSDGTIILANKATVSIGVSGFDANNVNSYTVTRKSMLFKDVNPVAKTSDDETAVTTSKLNEAMRGLDANGWLVANKVMIYNGEYYLLEVDENDNNVWYILTTTPQDGHNYDRTTYYVDRATENYTHGNETAILTLDNLRGYTFAGWSTTPELSGSGVARSRVNDTMTLYPRYSVVSTRIVLPNGLAEANLVLVYSNTNDNYYAKIATAGEANLTAVGTIAFAENTELNGTNNKYLDLAYGKTVTFKATIKEGYSVNDFNFLLDKDDDNYIKKISYSLVDSMNGTTYVGQTKTYTISISYIYATSQATLQCDAEDVKANVYNLTLYAPSTFDYDNNVVTFTKVTDAASPEGASAEIQHESSLNKTGRAQLIENNPTLEGWSFVSWIVSDETTAKGWYEQGNTSNATRFTVDTQIYRDTNVYAMFVRNEYAVNIHNFCFETNEFIDSNQALINDTTNPYVTLNEIKYHTTLSDANMGDSLAGGKFTEAKSYYFATKDLNTTIEQLRSGDITVDDLNEFVVGQTNVLDNITILRGYSRNKFTVTFMEDNVVVGEIKEVYYGSKLDASQIPECTNVPYGYHFKEWNNADGTSVLDESTIITGDTTFITDSYSYMGFETNIYGFKFNILSETGTVGNRGYVVAGNTDVTFTNGVLKVPFSKNVGTNAALLRVIFEPKTGYAGNDNNPPVVTVKYNGREIVLPFEYLRVVNTKAQWYISLANNTLKGIDADGICNDGTNIVTRFNEGDVFEVTIGAKKNIYASIFGSSPSWSDEEGTYSLESTSDKNNNYYAFIYDNNNATNIPLKLTAMPTEHGETMTILAQVSSSYNFMSKFVITVTDGTTTKQYTIDKDSLIVNQEGSILTYSCELKFANITDNLTVSVDTTNTRIINNDYDITFHMMFGGGVNGWFDRQLYFKNGAWTTDKTNADKVQAKYVADSARSHEIDNFGQYVVPSANFGYATNTVWCERAGEARWYRVKLMYKNIKFADITPDNWSEYFEEVDANTTYDRTTALYAIFFVKTVNVTAEAGQEDSKGKFVGTTGKADMIDPKIEDMSGRGYSFKYTVSTEYSNSIPVISVIGADNYDLVILPYSVFSNMEIGKGIEVKKNASVVYAVTRTSNGYNYITNGGSTYVVEYKDGRYVFGSLNVVVVPNGAEYAITLNSINGNFSLSSNQNMFTINTYKVTYVLPDGTKKVEEVEYGKTLANIPSVSANFFQKIVYKVKYVNGKTETVNAKSLKDIEFTSNATIEIEVQMNVVMVSIVGVVALAAVVAVVVVLINARRNKAYKKKAQSENAEAFAQLKKKDQNKTDNNQNGENGPRI